MMALQKLEVQVWYNYVMYNWSTDIKFLSKYPEKYKIWQLNQLINFGLNGEKLDLKLVKKYWRRLSLDRKRRNFLKLLLWGKVS